MFETALKLEAPHNLPGFWILLEDLVWNDGIELVVPAGFLTDLASVPIGFRNVLNINGLSRSPAVLHDFLYRTHLVSRGGADLLFREALKAEGMGLTRYVYWAGVRVGGWLAWRKHEKNAGS